MVPSPFLHACALLSVFLQLKPQFLCSCSACGYVADSVPRNCPVSTLSFCLFSAQHCCILDSTPCVLVGGFCQSWCWNLNVPCRLVNYTVYLALLSFFGQAILQIKEKEGKKSPIVLLNPFKASGVRLSVLLHLSFYLRISTLPSASNLFCIVVLRPMLFEISQEPVCWESPKVHKSQTLVAYLGSHLLCDHRI